MSRLFLIEQQFKLTLKELKGNKKVNKKLCYHAMFHNLNFKLKLKGDIYFLQIPKPGIN
jgi:hypothetical protein